MKFQLIGKAFAMTLCLVLLCGSMYAQAQTDNPAGASAAAVKTTNAANASNDAKINLNSATAEQLTALPGIGAATAKLIIEHRTNIGKFNRVEEMLNIKGIGEKKFEAIKDRLTL